jgi:type II secretory pathway component GspD/PulD (secretin)
MKLASRTLALTFTFALTNLFALAQAAPKPASDAAASAKPAQDSAPRSRPNLDALPMRTFYLKNATQTSDANEIITAIRNLVSTDDRVLMVPSRNAIVMRAPAEDFALVQQVLDDLDHPKKAYRLTYTITEMDGDKRLGTQHYSMDLVDGQQTTLNQGSRVPIATGSYSAGGPAPASSPVETQFRYQDVGITFDATLTSQANGARLLSNIDQSGVADAPAGGVPPPILRNSSLKGAYLLTSGKPLVLGTMDLPGSTHHLQIEALIEPLP